MGVCIPTTVIVDPVDGNLHDFQSVAVISTVSMNNLGLCHCAVIPTSGIPGICTYNFDRHQQTALHRGCSNTYAG